MRNSAHYCQVHGVTSVVRGGLQPKSPGTQGSFTRLRVWTMTKGLSTCLILTTWTLGVLFSVFSFLLTQHSVTGTNQHSCYLSLEFYGIYHLTFSAAYVTLGYVVPSVVMILLYSYTTKQLFIHRTLAEKNPFQNPRLFQPQSLAGNNTALPGRSLNVAMDGNQGPSERSNGGECALVDVNGDNLLSMEVDWESGVNSGSEDNYVQFTDAGCDGNGSVVTAAGVGDQTANGTNVPGESRENGSELSAHQTAIKSKSNQTAIGDRELLCNEVGAASMGVAGGASTVDAVSAGGGHGTGRPGHGAGGAVRGAGREGSGTTPRLAGLLGETDGPRCTHGCAVSQSCSEGPRTVIQVGDPRGHSAGQPTAPTQQTKSSLSQTPSPQPTHTSHLTRCPLKPGPERTVQPESSVVSNPREHRGCHPNPHPEPQPLVPAQQSRLPLTSSPRPLNPSLLGRVKDSKLLVVHVILFLLTTTPYFTMNLILSTGHWSSMEFPDTVYICLILLLNLNCFLCPLLCGFSHRPIRRAVVVHLKQRLRGTARDESRVHRKRRKLRLNWRTLSWMCCYGENRCCCVGCVRCCCRPRGREETPRDLDEISFVSGTGSGRGAEDCGIARSLSVISGSSTLS